MKTRSFLLGACALSALLGVACGNKAAPPGPAAGDAGAAGAVPTAAIQRGTQQAVVDAGAKVQPNVEYAENDFVESDRNRDPFRSYAASFVQQGPKTVTRQLAVVLPQFSLDELQLVAIVTGGDYPRAMLLDPQKKGWVIKRGDYVGRPDVVHTGGTNGVDYQLNWRVDRVREGDVVLTREDPAQPGVAPATRVIPLHPEADKDRN
ncbi:MAG: Type pilus biosis protein PilP [Myxococcaceae bacterium]|nr:Type pilus biosis protein PilP [Myxococcaceae bacterium]